MFSFDLSGKTALVTGAAHSIGFEIGCVLARQGATLCFNCSSQGSYGRGMAAYKETGIDAHGYICDVTDETAVNAMMEQIAVEVGPVDILLYVDGGILAYIGKHPQ